MKKYKIILILIVFITISSCFLKNNAIFCADTNSQLDNMNSCLSSNLPATKYYNCYKFSGSIPHFFTHEMIINPDKAFQSTNSLKKHYDKDCITSKEFENFLTQLYNNNFCLIDIYDLVGFKNGVPYIKDVYVPFNKKPFLLSFDDMSYDTRDKGLADKLILDKNGKFASYTSNADVPIEYNKESICILENFIEKHPDFSHNNARAIICPTGYNGLLGYRITSSYADTQKEINELIPVVKKLKSLNYHFACHTYNHINVKTISEQELVKDLSLYKEKILSIIGDTNIFCFPCGNFINNGYKLKILKDFDYKIFLCVGLNKEIKEYGNTIFLGRKTLDGNSLRNFHNIYIDYFDTFEMYDNDSRYIKINKKHTKDK